MKRIAAATVFVIATSAGAQSPLDSGFASADADRDGVITVAELDAQQRARFLDRDSNGDDALSIDEFTQPEPPGLTEPGRRQWAASRRLQFDSLDRDDNGWLTSREFAQTARRSFVAADLNRDAKLSQSEIETFIARASAALARGAADRRRSALDQDGDGRITQAEFIAARERAMTVRDANGDGAVAFEEFSPNFERLPADAQAAARAAFDRADVDGDGWIGLPEHREASAALFGRFDANGDGDLTPQELQGR